MILYKSEGARDNLSLVFLRFNPYGLTVSLAILIAYLLTASRAIKRGLNPDLVWDSLPWVAFFGLIGARLYHVLNFLGFYLQDPVLIPQVWRGGLGIFGGLVGGMVGLLLFFKRRTGDGFSISNFKFLGQYLDAAAPAIALGQAVGRLGNIFNGENLPYAWWEIIANLLIFFFLLVFERFFLYRNQRLKLRGLKALGFSRIRLSRFDDLESGNPAEAEIAIHPMVDNPSDFREGGLNIKDQKRKSNIKYHVDLFILYLLGYSTTRFLLEFYRRDSPWIAGPLTVSQWVSLGIIVSTRLTGRLFFGSFR